MYRFWRCPVPPAAWSWPPQEGVSGSHCHSSRAFVSLIVWRKAVETHDTLFSKNNFLRLCVSLSLLLFLVYHLILPRCFDQAQPGRNLIQKCLLNIPENQNVPKNKVLFIPRIVKMKNIYFLHTIFDKILTVPDFIPRFLINYCLNTIEIYQL